MHKNIGHRKLNNLARTRTVLIEQVNFEMIEVGNFTLSEIMNKLVTSYY